MRAKALCSSTKDPEAFKDSSLKDENSSEKKVSFGRFKLVFF